MQAMTCGLVTFATDKGGPVEIIEHNKSGFNIDPYNGEAAAELMADFFEKCANDRDHWSKMSQGAIKRILKHYTWKIYAERLMSLSRVYRWSCVTKILLRPLPYFCSIWSPYLCYYHYRADGLWYTIRCFLMHASLLACTFAPVCHVKSCTTFDLGRPAHARAFAACVDVLSDFVWSCKLDLQLPKTCHSKLIMLTVLWQHLLRRLPHDPRCHLAAFQEVQACFACASEWKIFFLLSFLMVKFFSCFCSFWKYVTTLDRQESRRYLEMLYHTKLRPLIASVPEAVNQPLTGDGEAHHFFWSPVKKGKTLSLVQISCGKKAMALCQPCQKKTNWTLLRCYFVKVTVSQLKSGLHHWEIVSLTQASSIDKSHWGRSFSQYYLSSKQAIWNCSRPYQLASVMTDGLSFFLRQQISHLLLKLVFATTLVSAQLLTWWWLTYTWTWGKPRERISHQLIILRWHACEYDYTKDCLRTRCCCCCCFWWEVCWLTRCCRRYFLIVLLTSWFCSVVYNSVLWGILDHAFPGYIRMRRRSHSMHKDSCKRYWQLRQRLVCVTLSCCNSDRLSLYNVIHTGSQVFKFDKPFF